MGLSTTFQRARGGSADALGELFQGCREYLMLVANEELEANLTAKVGGSDLVQETFLLAQQRFISFRGSSEAELLAWLRTILLHHLNTIRRRYVLAEKRCVSRERSLETNCYNLRVDANRQAKSPSRHAMDREEEHALNLALKQLSERHRRVIELRHREHFTFEAIARELELTPAAARKLWARAVERLQKEIKIRRG